MVLPLCSAHPAKHYVVPFSMSIIAALSESRLFFPLLSRINFITLPHPLKISCTQASFQNSLKLDKMKGMYQHCCKGKCWAGSVRKGYQVSFRGKDVPRASIAGRGGRQAGVGTLPWALAQRGSGTHQVLGRSGSLWKGRAFLFTRNSLLRRHAGTQSWDACTKMVHDFDKGQTSTGPPAISLGAVLQSGTMFIFYLLLQRMQKACEIPYIM